METLGPELLSNFLHSLASVGATDAQFFDAAAVAALPTLLDFDPHQLARIVWAFALADCRTLACAELVQRCHERFTSFSWRIFTSDELGWLNQFQIWAELELENTGILFAAAVRERCRDAMRQ